jgi:hypothetical protein
VRLLLQGGSHGRARSRCSRCWPAVASLASHHLLQTWPVVAATAAPPSSRRGHGRRSASILPENMSFLPPFYVFTSFVM